MLKFLMNWGKCFTFKTRGNLGGFMFLLIFCFFYGCNSTSYEKINEESITSIANTQKDEVVLADGFNYEVLLKGLDSLGPEEQFGFDVSGIAYFPIAEDKGMLWVNHELMDPKFVSGYSFEKGRTRKQIKSEERVVGGSYIGIKRNGDHWVRDGRRNVQINSKSKMGFLPDIFEGRKARGTVANRPILSLNEQIVLTAESNFENFYGNIAQTNKEFTPSVMHWESFYKETPLQYGWIVKTDLSNGESVKLSAPGRMKYGGLGLKENVLYYTNNISGGCLYKFVSDELGDFEKGEIFVADLVGSKWISVNIDHPKLNTLFGGDEKELLINLSVAGKEVGGTPLDNPSGVAISPIDGSIYLAESYSLVDQKYFGRIIEIKDDGQDFTWDTIVNGGLESGLACPENLTFDKKGNLWISTGIPSSLLNKGAYENFGNNSLFMLPVSREEMVKIASAPTDAEFSGIAFEPGGQFIFLGVQHPGSQTKSVANFDFTSHWPGGGVRSFPKSAVIVIGKK